MLSKKNSVAEAVAADMAGIMESDEYRSIFAKPTAPASNETVAATEPAKPVNSKRERFKLVVQGMAKMSEVLDELGLSTSSAFALKTLDQIISEATYMDDDGGDKDDEKEEKEEKEDKEKEEKDDNSADDEESEEDKAVEAEADEDKEDECEADGGVSSIPLPGSPESAAGKYQMRGHYTTAPAQRKVPGAGYSAPQRPVEERALPSGKPRGQSADDSGAHGAFESAIDVGIKHDEGMADDGIAATANDDLRELLTALGLESTAAKKTDKDMKKPGKKEEKKPAKKPAKKDEKAEKAEKAEKKSKKAWYTGADLVSLALGYEDYDHEVTEDEAEGFDEIRETAAKSSNGVILAFAKKEKERGSFIFPSTHPKVKSGDHFPINTEGRARNALARANQFSKAPSWWKGSLQELVSAVARAVKSKYKGIDVSKKSKKPGKG